MVYYTLFGVVTPVLPDVPARGLNLRSLSADLTRSGLTLSERLMLGVQSPPAACCSLHISRGGLSEMCQATVAGPPGTQMPS